MSKFKIGDIIQIEGPGLYIINNIYHYFTDHINYYFYTTNDSTAILDTTPLISTVFRIDDA